MSHLELHDFFEIIGGQEVSRSFRKITADRYRSVGMDDLALQVIDDRGRRWDFNHLSSGTKDQLLTVLRLVLAERRLGGKGFLILDDPLVNSDRTRLGEQMDLLGHEDFFIFFNMETNSVNVLYHRRDGSYGLIDTEVV